MTINKETVRDQLEKLIGDSTLKDFAAKTGVSTTSLSRYLKMTQEIKEETAEKIAKACGVEPNFLFEDNTPYGGKTFEEAKRMLLRAVFGRGNEPTLEDLYFGRRVTYNVADSLELDCVVIDAYKCEDEIVVIMCTKDCDFYETSNLDAITLVK